MQAFTNINKLVMAINGILVTYYLLIFQQIPYLGPWFQSLTERLFSEENIVTLEKVLIYGIGILTVLSILLFAITLKGPLLRLTMLLFAGYVAHIFIGKISVAFFSKFFKPWGLPDPWGPILLFTVAVLFTISMLLREAQFGKRNAPGH